MIGMVNALPAMLCPGYTSLLDSIVENGAGIKVI